MTTTLTSRAPTTGAPHGRQRRAHPSRAITLGLVAVLAGVVLVTEATGDASERQATTLAGPAAETAPTRPVEAASPPRVPAHAPPTSVADVPAHSGELRVQPQRLAPSPPADGRDAPDPAVVHDGGRWALFSTQVGHLNVPVALSDDLRRWSRPIDALPRLPDWAEWGHTWAPGVLPRDDGFVLYFAARSEALGLQCIGVATAPTIQGPYTSPAPKPFVCQPQLGGSIDPQPFVDADGTAYLLWKADSNAIGRTSQLFAQRLRPDGLALAGAPVALLLSDAEWERPLIENPAMLAADGLATGGRYLLFYSGGWWESEGYATGYALCDTPLGPCEKRTTGQPALASTGDEAGTGGASVMTGPDGDQWLAYHAWKPRTVGYDTGGARTLHFASLDWRSNELVVTREH